MQRRKRVVTQGKEAISEGRSDVDSVHGKLSSSPQQSEGFHIPRGVGSTTDVMSDNEGFTVKSSDNVLQIHSSQTRWGRASLLLSELS